MNTQLFDEDRIEDLRRRIAARHEEIGGPPAEIGLVPLELKCSMASCKHGRHCLDHLRKPRPGTERVRPGHCRDCGDLIVDFDYEATNAYDEAAAVEKVVLNQQCELIRAHYWHVPIDQWAYNQARRFGMTELRKRLEARVISTLTDPSPYGGRSAPYSRQILAYAQHATATCCRRCAAYWHGLPADVQVRPTDTQLRHVVAVANMYLDIRLPALPAEPEVPVPGIRTEMLPGRDAIATIDDHLISDLGAGIDPAGMVMPIRSRVHVEDRRGSLLLTQELDLR